MPLDGNESLYVTTDPDAEVLERAAELIEQFGHYPSAWETRSIDGEICIGCAITYAKHGIQVNSWDTKYLNFVALRLGFKAAGEMAIWNASACAAEVIARLRSAARG